MFNLSSIARSKKPPALTAELSVGKPGISKNLAFDSVDIPPPSDVNLPGSTPGGPIYFATPDGVYRISDSNNFHAVPVPVQVKSVPFSTVIGRSVGQWVDTA